MNSSLKHKTQKRQNDVFTILTLAICIFTILRLSSLAAANRAASVDVPKG
ncbi:hypothetical protein LguiA_009060 [Lonicera macranthoides]